MSTPRRGRKPDVGLRHDPHAWIWYILAGAAIDDIFAGVKLLWHAIGVAVWTMVAVFLASVLGIAGLLHVRFWLFRWVPSMDGVHAVRMGFVLSLFLFAWAWLHLLRAIFRGIAPRTYKKAAITLRYSANLAMVTPVIMFTKATWRTDGANFFGGMLAALEDPENDGLNKSKLAQERERAAWDLRSIDFLDERQARTDALRIVRSAFRAGWSERSNTIGSDREPKMPSLPRAVKAVRLTTRGVSVHLKWAAGGSYEPFAGGGTSGRAGIVTQLKSFWHLPHRSEALEWFSDGLDADEVIMYLNYTDDLPKVSEAPEFEDGDQE